MDLTNRRVVRQLLRQYGISPRKHWGQNFLVSRTILNRIVAEADIRPDDTALEIGGGTGTLTVELAKRAGRVVVYERDPKLCEVLHETLQPYPNVELRCVDARRITADQLPAASYKLVANLPYGVATAILRGFLESERPPQQSIVMLQREVAKRITAKPPRMSLLAVTIRTLVEPTMLFRVPSRAFWPEPDVESAVLRLSPLKAEGGQTPLGLDERRRMIAVAKRGFAHKRKRVFANLTKTGREQEKLARRCAIPLHARAEQLSLKQWKCLAHFSFHA